LYSEICEIRSIDEKIIKYFDKWPHHHKYDGDLIDKYFEDFIAEFDENIISENDIIAKINEGHYKVDLPEGIAIQILEENPSCPTCGKIGRKVFNSVFKSNVKAGSLSKIELDKVNFICYNSNCETVYYDDNKMIINHAELNIEIWFKKASKRKIICYCNNIDKEQIREAIKKNNLESWEEITSHYRKKVIENCEILNPTGYCCRETFDKLVNKLKKKQYGSKK